MSAIGFFEADESRRPVTRRLGTPLEIERAIPLAREADVESRMAASGVEPRIRRELLTRLMNIVIASFGLLVASPIMFIVAALVKLTSPGPILYSQPRVGLDRRRTTEQSGMYDRRTRDLGGSPFMIYKFRTMRVNAETIHGAVWATKGDARVTTIGGVLRKLRLDELPQLFNVLIGDMNIVGPRPERPSIFSRLRDDIAEYQFRQRARPGITGWAQVNQSYDTSVDDVRRKVRYDLEYLQRQGIREDLRIMAMTVPVILFRKGGW
ncbi:MAG TPA: sugar transferase [Gemmatimonadaceae bacterium]|jgi:lipopolysaccharide/colanic/teichoic acid biosynthesis glycosyltransferase|nr:sugar transferase [Gemmatimonadaceae bacterium]